jgi:SNF2 family DNA or RNA helicase
VFKRLYEGRKDPLALSRLARRVVPFMLRRAKAQVASELPPRVEEDLLVELEPGQQKLYDAELKRARLMLLDIKTNRDFDAQRFNILTSLLRLRQICCHPALLGKKFDSTPSAKFDALFEQIEPILAEGHKVLIFSQFVTLLDLLSEELDRRELAHLTITGKTENRQDLVDRFQQPGGESIFLLSLKAAGTGLNLTAASYVVLFDPWWNPAVEAQAIDRTHRIGQSGQVIAYRLIAQNTVEEKIRLLQKEKAALAAAIVQEEALATVLNLDDLRHILG